MFLKLGIAQQNSGNKEAAVLAWQKYLELAPNGAPAATIRAQIATMTANAPTTTPAATTTILAFSGGYL